MTSFTKDLDEKLDYSLALVYRQDLQLVSFPETADLPDLFAMTCRLHLPEGHP